MAIVLEFEVGVGNIARPFLKVNINELELS